RPRRPRADSKSLENPVGFCERCCTVLPVPAITESSGHRSVIARAGLSCRKDHRVPGTTSRSAPSKALCAVPGGETRSIRHPQTGQTSDTSVYPCVGFRLCELEALEVEAAGGVDDFDDDGLDAAGGPLVETFLDLVGVEGAVVGRHPRPE